MILLTFDSTHKAMAFERKLKGVLKTILIPTPTAITASCGISLKIEASYEKIYKVIESEDLSGVYCYTIVDMNQKIFEKKSWE